MATFKRFEDIQAWQKARHVTQLVFQISSVGEFARDFGLRDQMRRAAVSMMANIAEGHGRRTRNEFANFLNIARGSAIELQSHLYVALDLVYIDQVLFDELYSLLDELSRMTISLAKYLRDRTVKLSKLAELDKL
jgi:four helix bundle protein